MAPGEAPHFSTTLRISRQDDSAMSMNVTIWAARAEKVGSEKACRSLPLYNHTVATQDDSAFSNSPVVAMKGVSVKARGLLFQALRTTSFPSGFHRLSHPNHFQSIQ